MPTSVRCPNPACHATVSLADTAAPRHRCPTCGKAFALRPSGSIDRATPDPRSAVAGTDPFPTLPTLFGRYRVLRLLGRGGMGAVYLAEDTRLGRQVALKLPFAGVADSPQRLERFLREARSAAGLDHPNVCTVFDADQIDGRPFLTMAYFPGRSLADEIAACPLPERRAAEIAQKLARGLDHAHARGLIHRDLKPANVLLNADGEPVLTDFGLAKHVDFGDAAKLTREGGLVGTPSYMSPEQVQGDPNVGAATDVYSLGVVLFEMLTGRVPYGGGMVTVLGQILAAPVPPVGEFRPGVDPHLAAICQMAMRKAPADRFPGMAAFAAALGDYLGMDVDGPEIDVSLVVPTAPAPAAHPTRSGLAEPTGAFDNLAVSTGPSPRPAARSEWTSAKRIGALVVGIVIAVAAAVAFLMGGAPTGTVDVEFDIADVARAKAARLVLTGTSGSARHSWAIGDPPRAVEVGTYKAAVEGADGLAADPEQITVNRRETATVRVSLVPPKLKPKTPKVEETGPQTNSIGMRFVHVPNGKFIMGSPATEVGHNAPNWGRETEHEVVITRDFHMAVTLVTQSQFRRVMGFNPSHFSHDGRPADTGSYPHNAPAGGSARVGAFIQKELDDFPVDNVSHDDAKAFCDKLAAMPAERDGGRTYRLPTSAEWEYACRGGPTSSRKPFHFKQPSDSLSSHQANFNGLAPYGGGKVGPRLLRTCKVASFEPNALGLFDMHGQVWQWCSDWYAPDYADRSPTRDPPGPDTGTERVYRGGGWGDPGVNHRAAVIAFAIPTNRQSNYGFRVVMTQAR